MKLLRISQTGGEFRNEAGDFVPIDKIGKEGLLRLVDWSLHEETASFDEYDENHLKNQAHQLIYKSVVQKLVALRKRRKSFLDESARLYLEDYEKYRSSVSK
jgi:hypothetical protein